MDRYADIKLAVLRVLFERANSEKPADPSLTAQVIKDRAGVEVSRSVVLISLEELCEEGVLSKPASGVRERYQITGRGIQLFEGDRLEGFGLDSSLWTGELDRRKISEAKRREILSEIEKLKPIVADADLTQEQKSQAGAMITALITLAEAPDPPWQIIKEILILIAAIAACFSLAIKIAEMIA